LIAFQIYFSLLAMHLGCTVKYCIWYEWVFSKCKLILNNFKYSFMTFFWCSSLAGIAVMPKKPWKWIKLNVVKPHLRLEKKSSFTWEKWNQVWWLPSSHVRSQGLSLSIDSSLKLSRERQTDFASILTFNFAEKEHDWSSEN